MNLAAALYANGRDRYELDNQVERLLTGLFPAWSRWSFIAPDGLEVWQSLDSDRAFEVLRRHGFNSVTLHHHRAERFLTCTCKTHEVT